MSEKRITVTSKLFVFFYNVINAFLKSPTLRHQGFAPSPSEQVHRDHYLGTCTIPEVSRTIHSQKRLAKKKLNGRGQMTHYNIMTHRR